MFSQKSLKDTYALITGGSEGVGREFATQMAALGMNLVLVARNESALNETAKTLRERFSQNVEIIAADLTDPSAFLRIKNFLQQKSIQIKVLVNNAGTGSWGAFEKAADEDFSKMLDLNVKAPVLLSKMLFGELSRMNESAIINVSSLAAVQPVPYMSVYAATKSFVTHFSLALWNEWERHGIYVQTLMPGAIETHFDKKSGGFQAPFRKDTPEHIVQLSLAALLSNQAPLVYAKKSLVQRVFAKILPLPFLVREVGKVFSKNLPR